MKKPFGRYGLYKSISRLQGLRCTSSVHEGVSIRADDPGVKNTVNKENYFDSIVWYVYIDAFVAICQCIALWQGTCYNYS